MISFGYTKKVKIGIQNQVLVWPESLGRDSRQISACQDSLGRDLKLGFAMQRISRLCFKNRLHHAEKFFVWIKNWFQPGKNVQTQIQKNIWIYQESLHRDSNVGLDIPRKSLQGLNNRFCHAEKFFVEIKNRFNMARVSKHGLKRSFGYTKKVYKGINMQVWTYQESLFRD